MDQPINWTGAEDTPLGRELEMVGRACSADPSRGAVLKEDVVTALQALVPHLQIAHICEAGQ